MTHALSERLAGEHAARLLLHALRWELAGPGADRLSDQDRRAWIRVAGALERALRQDPAHHSPALLVTPS